MPVVRHGRSMPVTRASRSMPVLRACLGLTVPGAARIGPGLLLLVAASLLLQAGPLCLRQVAPFLAQLSAPPVGPHRVLRQPAAPEH
jgi:hypothetical protein